MTTTRAWAVLGCLLVVLGGCAKKGAGEAGGAPAVSPFAVTVHKVEKLDVVAPNQTYIDQGLGKRAGAGKTFLCVQYEVKNVGGAQATTAGAPGRLQVSVSALPSPTIVNAKGVKTDISINAAGAYMPADWPADLGDVAPGATAKRADCFVVAADATAGLKLVFEGDSPTGQGPGWKTSVDLPSP